MGAITAEIRSLHGDATPIDIVIDHQLLHIDDRQRRSVREVAEAGATWIIEYVPVVRDVERLIDGIRNGPPVLEPSISRPEPLPAGPSASRGT